MVNKYCKLLNLQSVGFTLFEVTLTLVLSTIVLAISGSFISSSVNIVTQTAAESSAINTNITSSSNINNNIAFTILDNDFANNLGGVSQNGDKNQLKFHILDPNNSTKTINVTYDCKTDPKNRFFFRQMEGYPQEILITSVTKCSFNYVISSDQTTITLTSAITVTTNGNSVVLSNVTTGPYTS
jgi:cell division protein FtsL